MEFADKLSSELKLPIVERDQQRKVVIALTDLDGTVNNETLKEAQRISSVGPAREAVQQLENIGISIGVITARSFGEAEMYLKALDAHGFTICEDGAVLILPQSGPSVSQAKLSGRMRFVEHGNRQAVVLSEVDTQYIGRYLKYILDMDKSESAGTSQKFVATCFDSPEEIQRLAGHENVDLARLSAERLASAYVVGASQKQAEMIQRYAEKWGIRTFMRVFGDPILLFGQDVHKGDALQTLNDNIGFFYPGHGRLTGIIPIVFGNHTNDIKLFERAHQMGGVGVIVKHPDGGYAVSESDIPDFVIQSGEPYGFGMKASVPKVFDFLRSHYAVNLG